MHTFGGTKARIGKLPSRFSSYTGALAVRFGGVLAIPMPEMRLSGVELAEPGAISRRHFLALVGEPVERELGFQTRYTLKAGDRHILSAFLLQSCMRG